MAIFNGFQKKAPPRLQNGMRAEVLDMAGARIFSGRLRILDEGVLEVRAAENAPLSPPPTYHQEVRVRSFTEDGETISLNGIILGSGLRVWRIEWRRRRPAPSSFNQRNTFRQHANIEGRLRTPTGQVISCKVQNVSAEGVQISAPRLFQLGSSLYLEVTLLPNEPPFSLSCQVKRVQVPPRQESPSKKYLYGCQLVDLSPREQERLLRTIFILERNAYRFREENL